MTMHFERITTLAAGAGVGRRLTCGVMRAPKKKPGEKLRPWRVLLMRARAQQLGIVYAVDQKAAEAAAIAEFKIGDDQRHRLIVRADD
jgi:hypothetical protein